MNHPAGKLTRQLLAFSRHSVLKPELLDLNRIVERLSAMLRRLIGVRIRLETRLAPNLGLIHADEPQMELVVMNLVLNARDSMPDGGCITLTTENVGADRVRLSVTDEGTGIAQEDLDRIFQPFFTTKDPGEGTGIGLATVEHAVELAGGHVDVESTLGRGSVFRILFPRASGQERRRTTAPPRELASGEGVILLVEDDDAVRSIASQALELAGYDVLGAASAEDALRLADEHDGPIDLLITDVVLPRMSGPELVRRIQTLRPGVATLLVSGYATTEFDATELTKGELEVMAKPFTPSSLTGRVRELLGLAES